MEEEKRNKKLILIPLLSYLAGIYYLKNRYGLDFHLNTIDFAPVSVFFCVFATVYSIGLYSYWRPKQIMGEIK